MEIDAIDEKIINELSKNSKITVRKLGRKVGTSFVTATKRTRRLQKEGVIERYTTKVNYEKIGYGVHVMIDLRISKGKLFELEKKVAKYPNIYAVYDTTGEFDATVIGRFRSTRSMDNFLKRVQTFDFVERSNTKLILNTIKEDHVTVKRT
jgi:Lrp/AsnC family leucine-responsive transcriptional regulator